MNGLRLTEPQRKAFHGLTVKLKGDVVMGLAPDDELIIQHPASNRWWRMSAAGVITRLEFMR